MILEFPNVQNGEIPHVGKLGKLGKLGKWRIWGKSKLVMRCERSEHRITNAAGVGLSKIYLAVGRLRWNDRRERRVII